MTAKHECEICGRFVDVESMSFDYEDHGYYANICDDCLEAKREGEKELDKNNWFMKER